MSIARTLYISRMLTAVNRVCAGELRDVDGTDAHVVFLPTNGATQPQKDAALVIIAAYDDIAEQLTEGRADALVVLAGLGAQSKIARALMLVILDELNLHAAKMKEILDASDASTSAADFKARVSAIADYPQRIPSQIVTAITAKINSGAADS